ncbi:hypothetical protein Btru_050366 [Bulinus truncatus]|nr:hypothetical protein Btru_050366 [Bulinus truncatus]
MSDVSQVVRDAIAEAKSTKTVLNQLKETISSLRNNPTRSPPLSVLDQTTTVVQKVNDNVQQVEAMEALLPVLLDKQYELISLYEQLSALLETDRSLADKPEMKDLQNEMENLMSVIFRQKESIAGPS